MKRRLLTLLAKNWRKNDDKLYVQTWFYMPGGRGHYSGDSMRKFLQYVCGSLGGHELSKTEWGYGGGDYADRHCRWCDKVLKVPKESIYFAFKDCNPKELMDEVDRDK